MEAGLTAGAAEFSLRATDLLTDNNHADQVKKYAR